MQISCELKMRKKIDVYKPNNIYFWMMLIVFAITCILLIKYLRFVGFLIFLILIKPGMELMKKIEKILK